jgi:hypothetical protein
MPAGTQADINWWNLLNRKLQDGLTPLQHIQAQVTQLERIDREIDQVAQIRLIQQKKLDRLRALKEKITILKTRRATTQQGIATAQKTITNFDTENAQLIADVETEKSIVAKNNLIALCYRDFVARLNTYKDRLPSKLVSDLGDLIVTLYNAFNRYDAVEEQLSSVQLPLSPNQRLLIAFNRSRFSIKLKL